METGGTVPPPPPPYHAFPDSGQLGTVWGREPLPHHFPMPFPLVFSASSPSLETDRQEQTVGTDHSLLHF